MVWLKRLSCSSNIRFDIKVAFICLMHVLYVRLSYIHINVVWYHWHKKVDLIFFGCKIECEKFFKRTLAYSFQWSILFCSYKIYAHKPANYTINLTHSDWLQRYNESLYNKYWFLNFLWLIDNIFALYA